MKTWKHLQKSRNGELLIYFLDHPCLTSLCHLAAIPRPSGYESDAKRNPDCIACLWLHSSLKRGENFRVHTNNNPFPCFFSIHL
jgi:hypothetical protein